jgi:multimeric flavodoxin WrbA
MYGHIQKLAEAEKKGIEAAGGEATIYQCDNSFHSNLQFLAAVLIT